MEEIFERMGDTDGNFVDDFQGPGFHSRLFELACFAYFESTGWTVRRGKPSPDFLVTKGAGVLAVEAVTSNPRMGRETDIAVNLIPHPSTEDMGGKCNEELPIRLGSALYSKVQRRYWERPECRGLPFILFVGAFHEAGSTTYVDESVARYLFGADRYLDWTVRNGVFVREAPVSSHSLGDKTIPSNFFATENAEHVSAVLWCNQFTISRFLRIDAEVPLADGAIASTSTFEVRDGRTVRTVHGFHPVLATTHLRGWASPKPASRL
jgi:hypothetical protein